MSERAGPPWGRIVHRDQARRNVEASALMDSSDHTGVHTCEDPSSCPTKERPMSREKLDSPEMQAKIVKAKARARAADGGAGKTADDLNGRGDLFCEHRVFMGDANPSHPCPECAAQHREEEHP